MINSTRSVKDISVKFGFKPKLTKFLVILGKLGSSC